ncbi:unnamed protein product, partial [Amoebophrya sp. A25]
LEDLPRRTELVQDAYQRITEIEEAFEKLELEELRVLSQLAVGRTRRRRLLALRGKSEAPPQDG